MSYDEKWTFFGGKIDISDNQDALTTAQREYDEESGSYPLVWAREKEIFWFANMKYVLFCLPSPLLDAPHFHSHLSLLHSLTKEEMSTPQREEGEGEGEKKKKKVFADLAKSVRWMELGCVATLPNIHFVVKNAISFRLFEGVLRGKKSERK